MSSSKTTKSERPTQLLEVVARPLVAFATVAIPLVILSVARLHAVLKRLPRNALAFLYGAVICFFGGTFPTLFAALQAAEHGGRQAVVRAVTALADEAMVIVEASQKDDGADEDRDGKSDVDQISGTELLRRKTLLVLKKMDPLKVNDAVGSLYKVWLAVVAVLSIQFARTISMSLTIAQFLQMPCKRFVEPVLDRVVPKDYKKWIPVALGWICKSIAMSMAWSIQSVISAAASACDGGLVMARALYAFCVAHKLKLAGLIPDRHEDTYADELFSYVFAFLGLYYQFKMGFNVPFPFSLVLWPFNLAEYCIRWSITK